MNQKALSYIYLTVHNRCHNYSLNSQCFPKMVINYRGAKWGIGKYYNWASSIRTHLVCIKGLKQKSQTALTVSAGTNA